MEPEEVVGRLLRAALDQREEFGVASPLAVVRRAEVGRVEGYELLGALEEHGLLYRDRDHGVRVTRAGRSLVDG